MAYKPHSIGITVLAMVLPLAPMSLLAASATSDLLIVLGMDGQSFTAHHTLASDGPLVSLEVPEDLNEHQIDFIGPNQNIHRENHPAPMSFVQLWNGVAVLRYQDRYSDEVTQLGPHSYRLTIPSLPQALTFEQTESIRSNLTWVFPDNLEVVSYSADSNDIGEWQYQENSLAYQQTDRFAITLTIEYRVKEALVANVSNNPKTNHEAFCFPTAANPDLCADDFDKDEIPDYRDVCLGSNLSERKLPATKQISRESTVQNASNEVIATAVDIETVTEKNKAKESTNLIEPETKTDAISATDDVQRSELTSNMQQLNDTTNENENENENEKPTQSDRTWQQSMGCRTSGNIVLEDVLFPSGYSYLDVESRTSLDRLAEALSRTDRNFEVAAHTDNAGDESTNAALSKKRAETVRYYLLLRGIKPNRLRAKGYGEQFPVSDNSTTEGRKANRRIEISVL